MWKAERWQRVSVGSGEVAAGSCKEQGGISRFMWRAERRQRVGVESWQRVHVESKEVAAGSCGEQGVTVDMRGELGGDSGFIWRAGR